MAVLELLRMMVARFFTFFVILFNFGDFVLFVDLQQLKQNGWTKVVNGSKYCKDFGFDKKNFFQKFFSYCRASLKFDDILKISKFAKLSKNLYLLCQNEKKKLKIVLTQENISFELWFGV